jgi:Pyridoxamine 5'-phosphate oxidase
MPGREPAAKLDARSAHVTPLIAVWANDALYFCTGPTEQKARNLEQNPKTIMTTGCNTEPGLDLVLEGEAVRVTDDARLVRVAETYVAKYGPDWRFTVRDGAFHQEPDTMALVYEVAPTKGPGLSQGCLQPDQLQISPRLTAARDSSAW